MAHQGVVLHRFFFCFYIFFIASSKLVESTSSDKQDSKSKAAQDTRTAPLSASSTHRTNEILKPSQIRNRRSNLLTENAQFIDDNPGLDSAFLYSDQIMQNLLKTQSPKPLNYARSNFFLNLLKPRTTRYSSWDDHSLMHFGKRSVEDVNSDGKVLVKRSADLWSPNNVMHFGKKSGSETEVDDADMEIPDFKTDGQARLEETTANTPWNNDAEILDKKSTDPWHSMMSFGKKSELPVDDSKMEFDKKDDPWHNKMSFGKRFENSWDHNTMHFGKRDEPWHNMMSFGKKSDPWHSMMSFGKKSDPWHSMMSFGKRTENPWDHNTLHFGKRDDPWHNMMSFGKRSENPWDHNTLHFGKRDEPWHSMMSFGKKSDPWHNMMSFGKKSDNPWDHNTLHFGKRDDPWHNMMSFGKKSDNLGNNSTLSADKREEPWHSMMSFGKKSANDFGEHFTLHFGKRDEPWHNMMSFGKKSDYGFDHNTLHFGKRDEPWHNMMSFGKKSDNPWDHNTLHFGKRDEPWHNMMSFGKKSDNPWDHNTLHFGKKDEPWHDMMSFGKKSDNPWDHNTLHFGKKDEPWHSMMSFGKKSGLPEDDLLEDFERHSDPWEEYNGMAFYKKSDPWDHNTLHFGKKSEGLDSASSTQKEGNPSVKHIQKRSVNMWDEPNTEFQKTSDPKSESEDFENSMNVDKKFDWDHNTLHFGKKSEPWDNHNTMHFGKREPWDYHNTMHFGKRNPFDYHNTMHFGKKRDPWDYHNTMHFGKRDPWEQHNTMHFGKKRDPWDYHNTMHFGKRSDTHLKDGNTISQKNSENKEDKEEKELSTMKNVSTNEALISKTAEKKVAVKKRSPENLKPNKNNNTSDEHKKAHINQKLSVESRIIKRSLKSIDSLDEKEAGFGNDKQKLDDFTAEDNDKSTRQKNYIVKDIKNSESDIKSRINKRSVEPASFSKYSHELPENIEPNPEELSKDDFPDTVLHFGKRSTDDSEDIDKQLGIDASVVKKFDDYWNNHDTMHFGKKSDPWESHGTLHFGKRYNPWEEHSTMHFGKRDPWDTHSTLHFGKKFDPWEGHAKMHFGKRAADWDHNVMHFGKRDEMTSDDLQNVLNTEELLTLLSDPAKVKDLLEGRYDQQEIKENLRNLQAVVNSQLKDENIPFEEKYLLLKTYLKPIIKAILGRRVAEDAILENSVPYSEKFSDMYDSEVLNDGDGIFEVQEATPGRIILSDINYDDPIPKEVEDVNDGEYDENSKALDYLKVYKNYFKSKRGHFGKPELKRYFVPFQGPKSIVYPHAWFASQIRRSSLPRTTEYARRMEMKMAEKKEDPFNSYMHFGRR